MKKNDKPEIDIRHLMIDDWVLYEGRPCQIRMIAGKVEVEPDGEVNRRKIYPLLINEKDVKETIKRIKIFKGFVLSCRQDATTQQLIVDLSFQEVGRPMTYFSLPLRYYHQLQHLLLDAECPLRLNYWWTHKDEPEEAGDE